VKSTGKGSRGRQVVTHASVGKRADVQQLELAALVCSQAIRKNPNYAPIHNTAGLIQNELGQVNGAVGEFATAAKLDPKFFEAQMNYAAVNLGFRGFEQAQAAYTKALAMRPNDYDAHLGMALALRGPITGSENDYDQRVNAVQGELDAAKKLDANARTPTTTRASSRRSSRRRARSTRRSRRRSSASRSRSSSRSSTRRAASPSTTAP